MRHKKFFWLAVMLLFWMRWGVSGSATVRLDPHVGGRAAVVAGVHAGPSGSASVRDGTCDDGPCGEWQTPHDGCNEGWGNCVDCGYCGDDVCDPNYEDQDSCDEDCGYCGDGMCQAYWELDADCSLCPDDCGGSLCDTPTEPWCGQCTPNSPSCSGGTWCNAYGCCVEACSGSNCGTHARSCSLESISCETNADCCEDEHCFWNDDNEPPCSFCGICLPDYEDVEHFTASPSGK